MKISINISKKLEKILIENYGQNWLFSDIEDITELSEKQKEEIKNLQKIFYDKTFTKIQEMQELRSPEIINDCYYAKTYFRNKTYGKDYEFIGGLLVNGQNELMKDIVLSTGTIDKAHIYIREIVKALLKNKAVGLILYHNHPSNTTKFSEHDIKITKKVKTALNLLDMQLLDHFLITEKKIISLRSIDLNLFS